MDSKSVAVLKKILQHTESVLAYCVDCDTREEFEENKMRVEATVFNLMQIGELAKESLDDETKNQIISIPWRQIYGLRNRIVHGYSGVNMQIVWDTVKYDIPALQDEIKDYLTKTADIERKGEPDHDRA